MDSQIFWSPTQAIWSTFSPHLKALAEDLTSSNLINSTLLELSTLKRYVNSNQLKAGLKLRKEMF